MLVLQIMDGLCQLSQITKPDGIFSILKTPDGTGHSGPPRKKFGGKLFCFSPDFVEIFRVDYSSVLAKSFVGRVQDSRFGHHG
jgi:hypothetical protein